MKFESNHQPEKQTFDPEGLDFSSLVSAIQQINEQSIAQAKRAVNTGLILRNWLIGAYVAEYELSGADRAAYGEKLIPILSSRLLDMGMKRMQERELRRFCLFYKVYPQIRESLTPEFLALPMVNQLIQESVTPESSPFVKKIFSRLSFTHFSELISIDDPLKRSFYEVECVRGNWSVRALRRQINSLYYERSGLSLDKEKLSVIANETAEQCDPQLAIRDPYIFEFLGLKPQDVFPESNFEKALLNNLQEFLLEMGPGFCFEARQKSIIIGETRGFIDLVFYHRTLRCNVLIELKVDEFKHEHIGQLNTYVAWYKKHMMQEGDNPPVGLLLCTGKDHAMVEYALSGMSDRLFVSKYQLALPSTEDLQKFIDQKRIETTK